MKEFKQTCDKPYDRHEYKLVLKNGKSMTVDDYELVRALWHHYRLHADRIVVLDITAGKGF